MGDGVIDNNTWRRQKRRLLIVCPELHRRYDMRNLFLRPKHPRKQFVRFIRQAVRAVHGLPPGTLPGEEADNELLMRRIAFIDLKSTPGGASSRTPQIMRVTESKRQKIVRRIRAMDPTHIAVAGKAWSAFNRYIHQSIIRPGIVVFRIYHPSCHGMKATKYYYHVRGRLEAAR